MPSFAVKTPQRDYCATVERGLLARAAHYVPKGSGKLFVVTTEDVWRLHGEAFSRGFAGAIHEVLFFPGGEERKRLSHVETLAELMVRRGGDRSSVVIAFGGGIVNDMAGFLAAIFMRGIPVLQIPTTLQGQVDAAIGGKTGVNLIDGKNLIGSFHQPRLVLADIEVLDTLPRRELLAGYAEVVKYGLINDPAFFAWCEGHGAGIISGEASARRQAIAESCKAKAAIVGADERESGARALLNLGHTFGHALEAECGYSDDLLHGEAVAIGMVMAYDLSARLGLCPLEDAARVQRHLASLGLPTSPTWIDGRSWSSARLIEHMSQDKKVKDGRIGFVLVRGIGQAFTPAYVEPADVAAMLDEAIAA